MRPVEFQRFLDRDETCYATGTHSDMLVPQHRSGGMGGNRPENPAAIITFRSDINGLIESDPAYQRLAYFRGWKLRNEDPLEAPVHHVLWGWRMLLDDFTFRAATPAEIEEWTKWRR